MRSSSRREYERRVNRVLDYVSTHLDQDLGLTTLAEVALFSPFHFHRVFQSVMGETLNACVRRLRLQRAATILTHNPETAITQVALQCGFSSPAVFSREFKKKYGATPTQWRGGADEEYRKIRQADRKDGKAPEGEDAYAPRIDIDDERRRSMHVEVRDLPDMRLAYMRRHGAYGPEVGEVWDRFRRWALPRDLLGPGAVTLGVCHDNPEVTAPEKCRYDVGLVVDPAFEADEHVNLQTVPGGRYAVLAFKGRAEEVQQGWNHMFGVWLPDSGYQPDDRPCFERCFTAESADAEVFEMEICVPVRPL